jgi:hypothetical protein
MFFLYFFTYVPISLLVACTVREPITVAAPLRHEIYSFVRPLGSWVRIPLKAWLSVYVYSVCCVVLCVGSGLATD